MSGATIPGSTTLGSSVARARARDGHGDVAPTPVVHHQQHPGANFTNAQGIPGNNDANATLTVSSSGLTDSKAFSTAASALDAGHGDAELHERQRDRHDQRNVRGPLPQSPVRS